MLHFTGTAECKDEAQAKEVAKNISYITGVVCRCSGKNVEVMYEPSDMETEHEIEVKIVRLSDILESIPIHGVSILS